MTTERTVSMRDVLDFLFKNKTAISVIMLMSLTGSVGYCLLASPVYEAETKILVKIGREKLSEINVSPKEAQNILIQERTQNINNEIEILKGRYLVDKIYPKLKQAIESREQAAPLSITKKIRRFAKSAVANVKEIAYEPLYYIGWAKRLSKEEQLKEAIFRSVRVEFMEDTDIIRLAFRWSDPAFASFAVNTYASEYLIEHIKVNENEGSRDFYVDQIAANRETLTKLESELEQFYQSNGIYNITLQKELLLKSIEELEKKYHDAVIAYEDVRAKIANVKEMYEKTDAWVETPPIGKVGADLTDLKALDDAYFKLKADLNQTLESFRPGSREVQSIESQLSKLRKQKAESLRNILAIELTTMRSKKSSLEEYLAREKKLINGINSVTLAAEQLERKRNLVQTNYLMYVKKGEEFRISDDLSQRQITSVKIISPASPPLLPVYPKKSLIVGLSLAMGFFVSLSWALIGEFFDHTFKSNQEIATVLNLPLLMTVPAQTRRRNGQVGR